MVSPAPNSVRAGKGGIAESSGADRITNDGRNLRRRPPWLPFLLLALVIPAAQVGQWFDGLWLPAFGLGFSVVVLYGLRWLPALYLADLAGAVAWSKSMTSAEFAHTAEFIAALTVGYGLAAWIIRRGRVDISLRRLHDAVIFSALGGAGAAVGALAAMGVLVPQLTMSSDAFWKAVEYFAIRARS